MFAQFATCMIPLGVGAQSGAVGGTYRRPGISLGFRIIEKEEVPILHNTWNNARAI